MNKNRFPHFLQVKLVASPKLSPKFSCMVQPDTIEQNPFDRRAGESYPVYLERLRQGAKTINQKMALLDLESRSINVRAQLLYLDAAELNGRVKAALETLRSQA
jgi:hypothetical protein